MASVEIKSILPREKAFKVDLGDAEYEFSKNSAGVFTATVSNSKHIATLLKIDEAYALYEEGDAEPVIGEKEPPVPLRDPEPNAKPVASQGVELPKATEPQDPGQTDIDEENEDPEAPLPDAELGEMKLGDAIAGPDYEAMDIEALRALHIEKLGRAPHPSAGKEKLIAKIIENDKAA